MHNMDYAFPLFPFLSVKGSGGELVRMGFRVAVLIWMQACLLSRTQDVLTDLRQGDPKNKTRNAAR